MRRNVVGFAAAALLVAVVAATTGWRLAREHQHFCDQVRALNTVRTLGTSTDTSTEHGVVVIGDSYAQGWKLDEPFASWPTAMGRELDVGVEVDAFAGSGFTATHGCGQVAYGDRVAAAVSHRPTLVVVEGGLNDTRAPDADLVTGVGRVLAGLSGVDVVLVGPPLAPARAAADVRRVDAVLTRAAHRWRTPYVSTMSWPLRYLSDGLHLTPRSHDDFGRRVAASIRALDLGAVDDSSPKLSAAGP